MYPEGATKQPEVERKTCVKTISMELEGSEYHFGGTAHVPNEEQFTTGIFTYFDVRCTLRRAKSPESPDSTGKQQTDQAWKHYLNE